MAFFESVGEKLSSFGSDVSNKTKNMVDLSNMNSQLRTCEDNLRKTHMQIGELYYQMNKDNPAPEFAELFVKTKEAEAAIAQLKQSILTTRGLKLCPNCGGEMPVEASTCTKCGAALAVPAGQVAATSSAAPAQTVPTQTVPAQTVPAQTEEPRKIVANACPSCGTENTPGASFCENCGTKLN